VEVWPLAELAVRAGINDGRPAGGAAYFWNHYEMDYCFTWDAYAEGLAGLGNRHQVSLLLFF
jgi:hypothetical protein